MFSKFQPRPTVKEIYYAKIVLMQYEDATNFCVKEKSSQTKGTSDSAVVALAIGLMLAILLAPVLTILGMYHKFVLKKLYADCSGKDFENFRKLYVKIGIGLYVVVILLFLVAAIFTVGSLITISSYLLVFGGIAYLIASIFLCKKYKVKKEN